MKNPILEKPVYSENYGSDLTPTTAGELTPAVSITPTQSRRNLLLQHDSAEFLDNEQLPQSSDSLFFALWRSILVFIQTLWINFGLKSCKKQDMHISNDESSNELHHCYVVRYHEFSEILRLFFKNRQQDQNIHSVSTDLSINSIFKKILDWPAYILKKFIILLLTGNRYNVFKSPRPYTAPECLLSQIPNIHIRQHDEKAILDLFLHHLNSEISIGREDQNYALSNTHPELRQMLKKLFRASKRRKIDSKKQAKNSYNSRKKYFFSFILLMAIIQILSQIAKYFTAFLTVSLVLPMLGLVAICKWLSKTILKINRNNFSSSKVKIDFVSNQQVEQSPYIEKVPRPGQIFRKLTGDELFLFSDEYMVVVALAWMETLPIGNFREVVKNRMLNPSNCDPKLFSKIRKINKSLYWVIDDIPLDLTYHVTDFNVLNKKFNNKKLLLKDIIQVVTQKPLNTIHPLWRFVFLQNTTKPITFNYNGSGKTVGSSDKGECSLAILQVHHSVGDGPSLINLFINKILDCNLSLVTGRVTHSISTQKREVVLPKIQETSKKRSSRRSSIDGSNLYFSHKPITKFISFSDSETTPCSFKVRSQKIPTSHLRSTTTMNSTKFSKKNKTEILHYAYKQFFNCLKICSICLKTPARLWMYLSLRKEKDWENYMRKRPQLSRLQAVSNTLVVPLADLKYIKQTLIEIEAFQLEIFKNSIGVNLKKPTVTLHYTINDILVTCLIGAYRDYIHERTLDEEKKTRSPKTISTHDGKHSVFAQKHMNILLPVNVRKNLNECSKLENHFSACIIPFPVKRFCPYSLNRLSCVSKTLADYKASSKIFSQYIFERLLFASYPGLLYEALALETQTVSCVFSNVVGPEVLGSFNNRNITDLTFLVPRPTDVGIGISALSYEGYIHIVVNCDQSCLKNPNKYLKYVSKALENIKDECLALSLWLKKVAPLVKQLHELGYDMTRLFKTPEF